MNPIHMNANSACISEQADLRAFLTILMASRSMPSNSGSSNSSLRCLQTDRPSDVKWVVAIAAASQKTHCTKPRAASAPRDTTREFGETIRRTMKTSSTRMVNAPTKAAKVKVEVLSSNWRACLSARSQNKTHSAYRVLDVDRDTEDDCCRNDEDHSGDCT